jgi:hypothetical protein
MEDDDQHSIVTVLRDYSDVAKLQEPGVLEAFLEHPLTSALETITGAFAVGGKGMGLAAGRFAQGIVKGKMYEQLASEIRVLRKAGKIPENLGETKHGLYTWAELMKIIDEECPDEDRLEAIKAMFYAVNKVRPADHKAILEYQLWQIAKSLNSGELLLLKAILERGGTPVNHRRDWSAILAKDSGLQLGELVELQEVNLARMRLITEYRAGDSPQQFFDNRLTQLGRQFCANIDIYKVDLKAAMDGSD